jgi:hypothetical protein
MKEKLLQLNPLDRSLEAVKTPVAKLPVLNK